MARISCHSSNNLKHGNVNIKNTKFQRIVFMRLILGFSIDVQIIWTLKQPPSTLQFGSRVLEKWKLPREWYCAFRDCRKISVQGLREFKRINYLMLLLNLSTKFRFSDDSKGDESTLIPFKSLHVRSGTWRQSLSFIKTYV